MSSVPGPPQPFSVQPGPAQPFVPQAAQGSYAPYGRPVGPPPALVGCVPAAPGRRTGSAVLEGLASGLPVGCASVSLQVGLAKELPALVVLGAALGLAWLAGFVVVAAGFARTGASPGKKAMGLRLVDARTGGAPGPAAWGRFLLAGLGGAVLIGWIIAVVQILTNKRGDRSAWYDSSTNLILLDVVAGRDPFLAQQGELAPERPASAYDTGGAGRAPGADAGWGAPGLTAISSGQHGTQFSQQSAGGFAPPDQPFAGVPVLVGLDGAPLHPAGRLSAPVPPPPVAEPVAQPVAAVPAPPAPPAPPRAAFTFDSGDVREVTGAGTIGRMPRPAREGEAPVAPEPALLTITDVTRTVSKSHLSYEVEASGVRVTDLGSTNGSTVIVPDGTAVPLIAGTAVLVAYGSTVTVGEHSFTLARVTTPQEDFADAGETFLRDPR
ncbi:Uncharacterized membrane protein YckC, RDD family [Sanguibacter gelidistatuariae]|uniref:Uncharacterized membrane protein YckC, RDD family n=1 Tax=Sanguibacter gelidistatuariae TaxID=1814289 RepID=A0A1G6GR71_9MICO|nr:RDD family protein [Sanguibacter gelidistatuariae]SDB84343.1 Uncharacterized membrane protein YckC, RDD family [Sanguibacter gelidistatuariae]